MVERAGPIARLAELEVDPGRLDAFRRLLREEVEASVALEPGVLALHAVALPGAFPGAGSERRPASIRLLEVHVDQAACEAHLRSPHVRRDMAMSEGMALSLRLIEAEPVASRTKALG